MTEHQSEKSVTKYSSIRSGEKEKQEIRLPYLAVGFISFVWGTTFIAIKIGITWLPLFLFIGARESIAGMLLMLVGWFAGNKQLPSRKDILAQIGPGILLITVARGLMSYSVYYIPAGLTSLIIALIPVYVLIINIIRKEAVINLRILSGLTVGAIGMVLVFYQDLSIDASWGVVTGVLCALGGAIGWASGSVWVSHKSYNMHGALRSGLQLFFGGSALLLMSFFKETETESGVFTYPALWALVYLIIMGSFIGFMAYSYAIEHLPVAWVTLYAYINPLVAVVVAWLVLDEYISLRLFMAFVVTVSGVILVNNGYRRALKIKSTE